MEISLPREPGTEPKSGGRQAEDLADEIDHRLSEELPLQLNVFIDPTQTRQTPSPEAGRSPGRSPGPGRARCRGGPRLHSRRV